MLMSTKTPMKGASTGTITCSECDGRGRVFTSRYGGNDPDVWDAGPCLKCDGTGKLKVKIVTNFIYPPIPNRNCDWQAHIDGHEPDDDGNMMVGNGSPEYEAISDLLEQLEERV